jgi:hypothetical protein
MPRLTLVTATALLMLAGCSSGDGSDESASEPEATTTASSASPSASPDAPSGPSCDDVWRAGELLPADYTSCAADGETAEQEVTDCLDGSSLVVYLDSFYAITGQEIVEPDVAPLQDTEEFGAAYSACTGE